MSADLAPIEPAGYQDDDLAVQMSAREAQTLSIEDHLEIARLKAKGWTQRKIAEFIGVSQPAVCKALQRMTDKQDVVQAVLKAQSVTAAKHWGTAMEKAAERGDHRPSRELIEAAYPELRPQQGHSAGGGGVTIVIGQPGAPIALPDITIQAVSASQPALSPTKISELAPVSTGQVEI